MKVKLFRSTMPAWLQNHAQFSYISLEVLRQIGLEEEAAKTLAEIYSVEVDTKVHEPTMLVYNVQPHDAGSYYTEIVMVGDDDVVKRALAKLASALKDEDVHEEDIINELIEDFDPGSVCEARDEYTTTIVSGPCSVNYAIP